MRLAYRLQGQTTKGQGHYRSINADTRRAPYLLNGKAYELRTRYTDGGRWHASATGAMTSKIKRSRSHGHVISLSRVGLLAHKSPKFALGTLAKKQDAYDRQSQWPL